MSEKKRVEDILAELGKKIDHLVAETKNASHKITDEMEVQIQKLKEQKEKIEEEIKNRSSNPNEKWSEVKEYLNEAAEAVHKAIGTIFK